MPKIKNELLANSTAGISSEVVKFDHEGVGEIKSQELYNEVVKLPNFQAVVEPEAPKEEVKEVVEPKVKKEAPKSNSTKK